MKYLIRYRLILYVTLLVVVFADCSDSFAEDIVSIEIYEKKTICPDAVAFDPGGRFALSAKNGVVSIWDLHEGRLSRTVGTHENSFDKAIFSPKANRVLFGDHRWNKVKLWHIADGQMEKWTKFFLRMKFMSSSVAMMSRMDAMSLFSGRSERRRGCCSRAKATWTA